MPLSCLFSELSGLTTRGVRPAAPSRPATRTPTSIGAVFEAIAVGRLPDAAGGDPYVRAAVAGSDVSHGPWAGHGAVIWATTRRGRTGFVGVGAPRAAAALLADVVPELPAASRATLPRGWLSDLPPSLAGAVVKRMDWDWCWTDAPPEPVPGEDRAGWLGPDDAEDVRKLLAEASPETSTWPDDGHARRWAGIRDAGGTLVACLADTSRNQSVAHMSAVATAPHERRRGHARTLVAWVTRQFLAEGATMVTLGMYAGNDAARRLYAGLGFTMGQQFTTADLDAANAAPGAIR